MEEHWSEQLFYACENGEIEEVKKLLQNPNINVNWQNTLGFGDTPFSIACYFGNLEIVKLLLNDERVDINIVDNYYITPFSAASESGNVEVVEYILASGKEVNLKAKAWNGKTAIDATRERLNEEFQDRKKNCEKIVELLESFERNPNETRFKLRLKFGFAGKN